MPDTRTTDQLIDRLDEIETAVKGLTAAAVTDLPSAAGKLADYVNHMAEISLIHIELARRTATGWRPL